MKRRFIYKYQSPPAKKSTCAKQKRWQEKNFKIQFGILIVTALLVCVSFWNTCVSNRATNAMLRPVTAFEKSQSASLYVLESKAEWDVDPYRRYLFETKIIDESQIAAKNIEIKYRADLLEKDLDESIISYELGKTTNIEWIVDDITLRDTVSSRDNNNMLPYFHVRLRYDIGFGNKEIKHFGFSYDENGKKQCKHTYIENE